MPIVSAQIVFQGPKSQDQGSITRTSADTVASPTQSQQKSPAAQPSAVVTADSNAHQQSTNAQQKSNLLASAQELAQRVKSPVRPLLPSLPDVDSLLGGPLSGEASKKRTLPNPNIPPPPFTKVAKQAFGMAGRQDEASRLLPPQLRGR